MAAPLLQVKGLSFGYGPQPVLCAIDLDMQRGETVGLVGPNGCGKTTMLRLIARTLSPHEGDILLGGVPLHRFSRQLLSRRIALVPQNPLLPESFTALDVVLMGRTPYLGLLQREGPRDIARAHQAMEQTQIWPLAGRHISELSGGERQRVIIARALVQEPQLLLLDEPTTHLDIGHQVGIMDLVRRLQSQHRWGVLIAFHDLTLAARYCQRLVLLDRGRILCQGPPQEVLRAEHLEKVYQAEVWVGTHPLFGSPLVLPLSYRPHRGDRGSGRDTMES